jgi:hypothetical protein
MNGPITLVDIPETAVVIRSKSPKVVENAGIDVARMLIISSGPMCGTDELS